MVALLLGLWAILLLARGTPIGGWLQSALVRWPARRINQISEGQWLTFVLLVIGVGAVFWVLEAEGVQLLGMAAPEVVGFLSAAEVTAYADVLAAALVAVSAGGLRSAIGQARPLISRVRTGRTARRRSRPATDAAAANDDSPGDRLRLSA